MGKRCLGAWGMVRGTVKREETVWYRRKCASISGFRTEDRLEVIKTVWK